MEVGPDQVFVFMSISELLCARFVLDCTARFTITYKPEMIDRVGGHSEIPPTLCSSGWDSEATYEAAPPVPEKRFDLEEETAVGSGPPADSIVGGGGLMTTSVTSASSALGPSSPRSPLLSARVSMTSSAHSPTSPHSTGPSADRPPSADIPAAMAISGRTPANEELPYMTPPLHHVSHMGIFLFL